jgi:hypothetical protein
MTTKRPPCLLKWLRMATIEDVVMALSEDGSILDGIKAEVAALQQRVDDAEREARENIALAINEREAKEALG